MIAPQVFQGRLDSLAVATIKALTTVMHKSPAAKVTERTWNATQTDSCNADLWFVKVWQLHGKLSIRDKELAPFKVQGTHFKVRYLFIKIEMHIIDREQGSKISKVHSMIFIVVEDS